MRRNYRRASDIVLTIVVGRIYSAFLHVGKEVIKAIIMRALCAGGGGARLRSERFPRLIVKEKIM